MKFLIISMIHDPWGGSEEIIYAFAKQALIQNHTVIHSTFHFSKIAEKEFELIKLGMMHVQRRGHVESNIFRPKRILIKTINKILDLVSNPFEEAFHLKPDYILYNGTAFSITEEKKLLQYLLNNNIQYGIIGHYNKEDGSDLSDKNIELYKQIISNAKNLFFVSNRTVETIEKKIDTQLTNYSIIRNPVNLKINEYVKYPSESVYNFAMIGNIRNVHKGHDIAIDVLSRSSWKERNWHLNIYGSGSDRKALEEKIKEYGIENKISFKGVTNDIIKVWRENNLLLMPSRMEGIPLAVVEAMLSGRAVVATDVGGHKEWIRNEYDGWISPSVNVESFGETLEKAWLHKNDWENMGIRARERALSLYDNEPGKSLLNIILKK